MTGGYLQQIVESGTTSLRQVRGSIHGAPPPLDLEEQHTVGSAEPFARDEMGLDRVGALPAPRSDVRLDPSASPPEMALTEGDAASSELPAPDVQPLTRPEVHIEEGASHHTASGLRREAPGTPAAAPSLKDAGVRGVPLRDEAPAGQSTSRQRPLPLDASARSLERPSPHRGVSAERVEQWQRLKDRLLIDHYPPSRSNVVVAAEQSQASQPTNQRSGEAPHEIVIEQLEVVVAAPHPAPPPTPGPRSNSSRASAWSVATRRYLGRL